MPDLVLDLLKYVFLAVLYIFIARVVRFIYLELRPAGAAPASRRTAATPAPASMGGKKKAFRKAAVIEGAQKGKSFDLGEELIVGRAEKCHLVLDDDTYVSQMHARVFSRDGTFMIEDLGSTNGTYLNRRRITSPTELQRGDRVKIGKTVLEMRK